MAAIQRNSKVTAGAPGDNIKHATVKRTDNNNKPCGCTAAKIAVFTAGGAAAGAFTTKNPYGALAGGGAGLLVALTTGCKNPSINPIPTIKPSPKPTPPQFEYPTGQVQDEDDDAVSKTITTKPSTSSFSPTTAKPFNLVGNKISDLILNGAIESGHLFQRLFIDRTPLEGQEGLNLYLFSKVIDPSDDENPKKPDEAELSDDFSAHKVEIAKVTKGVSIPGMTVLSSAIGEDTIAQLIVGRDDGRLYGLFIEKDGSKRKTTVTEYKETKIEDFSNYKLVNDRSEIDWDAAENDKPIQLIIMRKKITTNGDKMLFIARNRKDGSIYAGIMDPKDGKIVTMYKYSNEN